MSLPFGRFLRLLAVIRGLRLHYHNRRNQCHAFMFYISEIWPILQPSFHVFHFYLPTVSQFMSSINSHSFLYNTQLGKNNSCLWMLILYGYCIKRRHMHTRYNHFSRQSVHSLALRYAIKFNTISEFMNSWCGGYCYHFHHNNFSMNLVSQSCTTKQSTTRLTVYINNFYLNGLLLILPFQSSTIFLKNLVSQSRTTDNRLLSSYINNLYLYSGWVFTLFRCASDLRQRSWFWPL